MSNPRTKMLQRWHRMKSKCHNPAAHAYEHYGGRGIYVCARWLGGEDGLSGLDCFIEDMGYPPEGLTLDRINNDGPYSPGNCRWASMSEQGLNTRRTTIVSYKGWEAKLHVVAKRYGICKYTLRDRLNKQGLDLSQAVSVPIQKDRANRYAVHGELLTLSEISDRYGVNRETIKTRIRRGASAEQAIANRPLGIFAGIRPLDNCSGKY